MSMQAFLVLGPESSGTRLATRIMIAAGCKGNTGDAQAFDNQLPVKSTPIVWRRSIPHGRHWPPIPIMIHELKQHGYKVAAVVTTRSWHPMIESQVRERHSPSREKALAKLRQAYPFILSPLRAEDVPYWLLHYEALVARPEETIANLVKATGLTMPEELPVIHDANGKYYEEEA